MDDRDPVAALRACIAALQGERMQLRDATHGGSTSVDGLEQCLRQVENILRDKDTVIGRLRETLEQVREKGCEEKSQRKDLHHESVAMDEGNGMSRDLYADMTTRSVCTPTGGSDLVEEAENSAGGVAVPLPSLDTGNNVRELEPGYDRMTEPVYGTTTPPIASAEETLPPISHESVPEDHPLCATTAEREQTATSGRHLGWNDN